MASPAQLAFENAGGGMNAFDPPHKIATNQVARMVNCAIVDGLPTTRVGARVVPFSGDSAEFVRAKPVQGSCFYNPAKGQGGIVFAASTASLALACGGRKFIVRLSGRRSQMKAVPEDISAGLFTNEQFHLVWLSQWEDLLVAADGESKTFIYSPKDGARFSRGYNSTDKPKSEIPNGATVLTYAHGRGITVVNSRLVLVGDNLHRVDQSSSSNLVQFTEQVYWATGQYFLPPSSMGGITAAGILPLKNTLHGHGEVIIHCEDGVFSLDISQYPRASWSEKSLTRIVASGPGAGACGPYALDGVDGDQVFRTLNGAQSLRSAAATPSPEGNPERTLSAEVDTWFASDYPRWLRFASVSAWESERRVLYTTQPIVQGSYRAHRGLISRNTDPGVTKGGDAAVWEGLWTLPPQCAGIIQTVDGIFDGEQRMFAWTRGSDRKNRLVLFSSALHSDVLEDGSERAIRSQVWTRAIDAGKWWISREFYRGRLYLRNIEGRVRWGVWYRTAENPAWKFWRKGEVLAPAVSEGSELDSPEARSKMFPLGSIPAECDPDTNGKTNVSRSIQFLVRWEGYCQFEGIYLTHGDADQSKDDLECGAVAQFSTPTGDGYDDFEYSNTDEPLWLL